MHAIMDAERDATLGYLDQLTQRTGRPAGRGRRSHRHHRPRLRPRPARHHPGRGPRAPRPRAHRQRDRDAGREGRHQGPRHHPLAGAPPRRHHGRAGGLGRPKPSSSATASRPTPAPRASSATGRSRASPMRPWPSTPSGPRRSTEAVAEQGLRLLPGPPGGRPRHQEHQAPHRSRRAAARMAEGAGRCRLPASSSWWPTSTGPAVSTDANTQPRRSSGTGSCAELTNTVLGPNGTLSERKVFAKRDVIVAIAPQALRPSAPSSWRRPPTGSSVIPTPSPWSVCPGPPNGPMPPPTSRHRTVHRTGCGAGCGEPGGSQSDARGGERLHWAANAPSWGLH